MPYTERHFDRLDRLLQSSRLVAYTLAAMKELQPPEGEPRDHARANGDLLPAP